jgi:hypothetical protein
MRVSSLATSTFAAMCDMREHFADFLERRLLCLWHIRKVYHTAAN